MVSKNTTVTFGLVNIPVKLYGVTGENNFSFNELHSVCGARGRRKKWCPVCDREVPQDEIQRGYEVSKDQYIVIYAKKIVMTSQPLFYMKYGNINHYYTA